MFAILFEGTGKNPELKRIMHVQLCQRFFFPYSNTLSHAMLRFCTKKNLLLQNVKWVLWFLELFLMHSPFLSGKCVSVEPPQKPLMYSNCQHIPCVLHRISLCHSSGVLFSLYLFFVVVLNAFWLLFGIRDNRFSYVRFFPLLLFSQWLHSNYTRREFFSVSLFKLSSIWRLHLRGEHAKSHNTEPT